PARVPLASSFAGRLDSREKQHRLRVLGGRVLLDGGQPDNGLLGRGSAGESSGGGGAGGGELAAGDGGDGDGGESEAADLHGVFSSGGVFRRFWGIDRRP